MNLDKVNVSYNSQDSGCAVMNTGLGTLNMKNGTIYSKTHGLATQGGTTTINNVTIYGENYGVKLWGRGNGKIYAYNSSINNGTICNHHYCAADDEPTWAVPYPEDTVILYNTNTNGQGIHGNVYEIKYIDSNTRDVIRYHTVGTNCPTWTLNNDQDDKKNYETLNTSHITCRVYKSLHNNESGYYATHFYNGSTIVGAFTWEW